MTETAVLTKEKITAGSRLASPFFPALLYALVTYLTTPYFMGDTADYVDSILTGIEFWEFGHVLWRPLGWVMFHLLHPVTGALLGFDERMSAAFGLILVNWVAGLVSVLAMRAFILRVVEDERAAFVATVAFIFSYAFLNFAQTGSSYIPGLALLIVALSILAKDDGGNSTPRRALLAGLALVGAVSMWFLYVWAVPAVLLSPFLLRDASALRRKLVWQTTLFFTLAVAIMYALVLAHLGIFTVAEMRAWIAASSHGAQISGVTRAAYGFCRSFIEMSNYGILFKRYLLGDPFNPVGFAELARTSLWKLMFFYSAIAAIVFNLWRSGRGRKILALFVINLIPTLGFALIFSGGDTERYFPLYPVLFLSLAFVLFDPRSVRPFTAVALLFFLIAGVLNFTSVARWRLDGEQTEITRRVEDIVPSLNPQSWIYTVNTQDELYNFKRAYLFNPIGAQRSFKVDFIVQFNTAQTEHWRRKFAKDVMASWQAGGAVWVTKRVQSARPLAHWNWVEGDDERVTWTDLYEFFAPMQFETASAADDGFLRLTPSDQNLQVLKGYLIAP